MSQVIVCVSAVITKGEISINSKKTASRRWPISSIENRTVSRSLRRIKARTMYIPYLVLRKKKNNNNNWYDLLLTKNRRRVRILEFYTRIFLFLKTFDLINVDKQLPQVLKTCERRDDWQYSPAVLSIKIIFKFKYYSCQARAVTKSVCRSLTTRVCTEQRQRPDGVL